MAKEKSSALAARLRSLREAAGYAQTEAASYLGVSRQTYIRFETGDSEPSFADVCKLAEMFGVDISAFKVDAE